MNTLFDISDKLNPDLVSSLQDVVNACQSLNTEVMIIGALARDIHFTLLHDLDPGRKTLDMDFAVLLENWTSFDTLAERLLELGYRQGREVKHAFTSRENVKVDLIPFGSIENPEGTIRWPEPQNAVMSTVGFVKAFESAVLCRCSRNPVLDIRVLSIAGLVALKFISWEERYPDRAKDAQDIRFMILRYLDAGQAERLYSAEQDLMEGDFNYELAGARLLGRDIARMGDAALLGTVSQILTSETDPNGASRFIGDVASPFGTGNELIPDLLAMVQNGIEDVTSAGAGD